MVMNTFATLNTTNLNIQAILERSLAPVALVAMEKLLQERLSNLKPSAKEKKRV